MNEKKWTPGPWLIHPCKYGELSIRSGNARDTRDATYMEIVGEVGGMIHGDDFDDYSEVEANAHLIAAAPDLYEALDRLVEASNPEISGWSEAVAALAKARGEL